MVEGDIEMHEKMQKDIEANMLKPEFAKNPDQEKIFNNYEKLKEKIARFYNEWDVLSAELEELNN